MNKDWDECVIRDSSRSIMMIVANQSRWCSYILIGVHSMVGISYTIGTYAFHALSTDVRQLPLRMEFSFDPTISPFFECILAAQLFYAVTIASIIGMINALLVCLVGWLRPWVSSLWLIDMNIRSEKWTMLFKPPQSQLSHFSDLAALLVWFMFAGTSCG